MMNPPAHFAEKLGQADLHMHSTYSDGIGTVKQILEYVQNFTQLDVIALTDHDTINGSLRARDLWAQHNYRFDFIVGEEVSTSDGHLLGLFIEKRVPSNLSMERSIDLIHAQGGLAIVPHPLCPLFRHSCQRKVLDHIYANKDVWPDAIEIWNASFCGIYANHQATRVNRKVYGWPEVGNSDAHTLNAIGRGYTWFKGQSAQDIRTGIETHSSLPGGKWWKVQDQLAWMQFRLSKEGRQARKRYAAYALEGFGG